MLSLQEIFNISATHLLTQKVRSVRPDSDWRCAYRGKSGLMCAVGVLIPEVAYRSDIEGSAAGYPDVLATLDGVLDTKDPETVAILIALQAIHDIDRPETWEENLRELAQIHRLKMPEAQS